MNIIVNADQKWGIGLNNKLLIRIPNDMKWFRQHTIGKVIIMGRKTLESFPQGQPLAGRTNIVLTTNPSYRVNGAEMVHSIEELFQKLKSYKDEDIYIVGGENIYKQLLPYCNKAYVTRVEHTYEADAHFPNLDEDEAWQMTEQSEEQTYFDMEYHFTVYEKINKAR